ncbi:hypothetical protein [Azospirillum soli]|uniref:hypothetical protein n=1 Tax=Azospirillum soli TaxID=1304799 RepID=UPI001AE4AA8B|nr:hypothetical protein [Azospirillum soli]MBP2311906.1 hypothetical protein [Azospirillum soli]
MTNHTEMWATPYGVEIAATLMEIDGKPEPMIDGENTAILLGIHDPEKRRGFTDELRILMETGGSMDAIVAKFGGGKPTQIPILPPLKPVYPTIPHERDAGHTTTNLSLRDITDSWVDALAEESRWFDRADVFLTMLGSQIEHFGAGARDMVGLSMSGIATAVLENLGETEIRCLEAAAFYALTMHDPWRAAGREWLLPHRKTWVRDWIKDRPVYRRLARLTGMVHRDVPSWLKEVL